MRGGVGRGSAVRASQSELMCSIGPHCAGLGCACAVPVLCSLGSLSPGPPPPLPSSSSSPLVLRQTSKISPRWHPPPPAPPHPAAPQRCLCVIVPQRHFDGAAAPSCPRVVESCCSAYLSFWFAVRMTGGPVDSPKPARGDFKYGFSVGVCL